MRYIIVILLWIGIFWLLAQRVFHKPGWQFLRQVCFGFIFVLSLLLIYIVIASLFGLPF
jgi:hypothetical protein